jgi:hypothetical protein
MKSYFMTGFPSPWRWVRRRYWRYRFNAMPSEFKTLAEIAGVSPDILIARGEL